MATIYRFIVENKIREGSEGRKSSKSSGATKGAAKKGRAVSLLGGGRGGVEHNRKMRAINPLLNKATGGYWEKGMRAGRAGLGLVRVNSETGKFAGFSPVSIAIIVALAIQTIFKIQNRDREIANQRNTQDFKMLENGIGGIHGDFEVSANMWNGRLTYNQNK